MKWSRFKQLNKSVIKKLEENRRRRKRTFPVSGGRFIHWFLSILPLHPFSVSQCTAHRSPSSHRVRAALTETDTSKLMKKCQDLEQWPSYCKAGQYPPFHCVAFRLIILPPSIRIYIFWLHFTWISFGNFTKIKHIKHEAVDYFTIYFISWLVITPCQVWLRLPPTRCWRSVLLTQWEEKNCIWKF